MKPLSNTLTALALLGGLSACNSPTSPGVRLELTGPAAIAPGEMGAYHLLAMSAGRGTRDVSVEALWASSAQAVAAIAGPGRAAAQQAGEVVISATYEGRTATLRVFVVPAGTFALQGTIREPATGTAVADARVQVLAGNAVVLETQTGPDGSYRLYGVARGTSLRVSKEGYVDSDWPLDITAHTQLDVHLSKRGAAGLYTLTVEMGGQCSSRLPDAARTRTYSASIEAFSDPGLLANYVVTLGDATFAPGCGSNLLSRGLRCNQFFARTSGSGLLFYMADYDWGEGGQITERLPDGTWLYIVAYDLLGSFDGPILQTSGRAQVGHCSSSQESPWRCGPTTVCETDEFSLRLSRRPPA